MHTYTVRGMSCASCAKTIERQLAKVPGVRAVVVNMVTNQARVEQGADFSLKAANAALAHLGYSLHTQETTSPPEVMHTHAPKHAIHDTDAHAHLHEHPVVAQQTLIGALIAAVFAVLFMLVEWAYALRGVPIPTVLSDAIHHVLPVLATFTLVTAGVPYLRGVWRFVRYGAANMDTLVGLGVVMAFAYSFTLAAFEKPLAPFVNTSVEYYEAVIVIVAFVSLGKYIEAASKRRTGEALTALAQLTAKVARVVRGDTEQDVSLAEVVVGDALRVRPGEQVPVDGVVLTGETHLDESLLTGESEPVSKREGDSVVGGAHNLEGSFTFRATAVGEATMLARIRQMVAEAQNSKAPIEALADSVSALLVPLVLGIALLTLAAWSVAGDIPRGIVSAVSVLVIACPCALGLATPLAIVVGVGQGAKRGILVRDAATLQTLAGIRTLVLDKTGTLTRGKPEVVTFNAYGTTEEDTLGILASLEQHSEHPLAHAIREYTQAHGVVLRSVNGFLAERGKGVTGTIDGIRYRAGSPTYVEVPLDAGQMGEVTAATTRGETPILLADDTRILAAVYVADALRDGAREVVSDLHERSYTVRLLSGDATGTAQYIAAQAGIAASDVTAGVLPEGKRDVIRALREAGVAAAMIGDGVNDAPALAEATVGIAMASGADVAIAASGITLVHGDIRRLPAALALARGTMRGIRQNLALAFLYNMAAIPLAAFGFLSPAIAGIAMTLSSLSVVGNTMRMMRT